MVITCRKCGKRFKMPATQLARLPETARCTGCNAVIPVKDTVAKAVAAKRNMRQVVCDGCGKKYAISVRDLPAHVTSTSCRACGGPIPLQEDSAKPGESAPSKVDRMFSDPSLLDTSDFDMSIMLSCGTLSGSGGTGAETLPLTGVGDSEHEESPEQVHAESVEIDFDKMMKLVKVLVIGALMIIIVGMGITQLRLYMSRQHKMREAQKAAQLEELQRLQSFSRKTETPAAANVAEAAAENQTLGVSEANGASAGAELEANVVSERLDLSEQPIGIDMRP